VWTSKQESFNKRSRVFAGWLGRKIWWSTGKLHIFFRIQWQGNDESCTIALSMLSTASSEGRMQKDEGGVNKPTNGQTTSVKKKEEKKKDRSSIRARTYGYSHASY
jgi:hypothetical protein